MDRVAAAAGVGKGTIFHRFGNRAGLLHEMVAESAVTLMNAVKEGPPPLGPGAGGGAARRILRGDGMAGDRQSRAHGRLPQRAPASENR
ncbi:helix-turn-helix domain-containing protein [Nocardia cyriacigeorgica]